MENNTFSLNIEDNCVVPENNHTPTTKRIGNSGMWQLENGQKRVTPCEYKNIKTLWGRALRRRGCRINCEWGGIVRNNIFPDTLPYKYPYFFPLSNRRHNRVSIIICHK